MHESCMSFVEQQLLRYRNISVATVTNTVNEVRMWHGNTRIVELGSQDVNGSPRHLPVLQVPGVEYVGVDIADGPGVDVVADARTVTPEVVGGTCQVVICTNVYEHVEDWPRIVQAAHGLLDTGGWFITQCAGPGFQVHSGRSESLVLEPDEWYRNVHPNDLYHAMKGAGFAAVQTWYRELWPHDTTGWASK